MRCLVVDCIDKLTAFSFARKLNHFVTMDPQHTGDLMKHLEKQNELLKETQKTMSHELQTLMVEEEMMMHKLCELMVTHRKNKKEMKKTQETVESSVVTVEAQRPPIIYQYRRKKSKAQQKTVQVSNGSDIDKGF
ncbi:uncharacterized protein LOC103862556 isoform X1 [Brassica rapa]|uniref:uncharacterized protein LOC103862556 isoform X1 n=1 Tax=Brassica campestris TaxID=3711 RepID=UPI0004F15171|nr:uncharacterized protein LOC103862556 isoform X1 [Brassica rapa]XP_013728990.1 uncharacterized protein LOC106432698 isoform X2 [Brassica napus]